jgi:hypothetical protein
MKSETVPLAMPSELARQIRKAAKETGLSMADVMRQSMKIGVPQLIVRLSKNVPLTNVEPLPDEVLERLYQDRDDDADSDGVKKLMSAQPIHPE